MTSINELIDRLEFNVKWQKTPEEITHDDYKKMIISGIEELFIDTGRANEYAEHTYIIDDDEDTIFDYDFPIDEKRYVLLCAEIEFFNKVQTDVNNIVGYTTDALTVTNADKPYANLKDTIALKENDRRRIFFKMVKYVV